MKGTVARDFRYELKRFSMKNTMKMIPGNNRAVKKVAKVESDVEYCWFALGALPFSRTAIQNPRNSRGTEIGNNRTSRAKMVV